MVLSRRKVIAGLGSLVAKPVFGFAKARSVAPVVIAPEGNPFLIRGASQYLTGMRLAVRTNGSFVATWIEHRAEGRSLAFARSYSAHGTPLAPAIRLSPMQVDSVAPIAAQGANTLAIMSVLHKQEEGFRGQTFAQNLNLLGAPTGAPKLVADAGSPIFSYIDVYAARLAGGNVLAAWREDPFGRFLPGALIGIDGTVKSRVSPIISANRFDVVPFSIAPLTDGGAAIGFATQKDSVSRRHTSIQLVDTSGQPIGREIILNGPMVGEQGYKINSFSLIGLSGGRFCAVWVRNQRLFWQIYSSTGDIIVPPRSTSLGGPFFGDSPLALAANEGQILVVTQRNIGNPMRSRISGWLMDSNGELIGEPVDIGQATSVDFVSALGPNRFLIVFSFFANCGRARIVRTSSA